MKMEKLVEELKEEFLCLKLLGYDISQYGNFFSIENEFSIYNCFYSSLSNKYLLNYMNGSTLIRESTIEEFKKKLIELL